jgi:hypothetical protein
MHVCRYVCMYMYVIYIYIYIYIEKGQFNKLTTMAGNSNIAEPMMMMKIRTGSDLVEVARS